METNIIGYILSLAGLAVIALSSKIAGLGFLAGLGNKALIYTIIAGVALIVVGIILITAGRGKIKHAAEEVPIYQGEGKKRKIIGYRKAD